MKKFIKTSIENCKKVAKYPFASIKLNLAISKADYAFNSTGERFYVMPNYDGKLLIINRQMFRLWKRKHLLNQEETINRLMVTSFYFTPNKGGFRLSQKDKDAKRRMYFKWALR